MFKNLLTRKLGVALEQEYAVLVKKPHAVLVASVNGKEGSVAIWVFKTVQTSTKQLVGTVIVPNVLGRREKLKATALNPVET